MILDNKSEEIILSDGEVQESTKMEIDAESHIFLMRMLSKFYSDGIGSLIRETASNALDSHREIGSTEPIIVSLKDSPQGGKEFSVQDFGAGMDDNDVKNIISKYGKSTKRQSTTQLGAFGLGFKSPLAYSNSFYFTGVKNGIERKWMMYEGEDEENKIDLLYEKPTTERNGVTVIVPVKWQDTGDFVRKIKEQLAYFENVYFNVPGITNDFSIIRHEHFQWSPLANDSSMHICLDNVYYPIDFAKLGIDRIYLPIGLRFSLTDGLYPLPNRETLKYTPEAKAVIMSKLKLAAEYFITKYNESIKDSDNLKAVFEYYDNSSKNVILSNNINIEVNQIAKYSKVPMVHPKLKGIKLLDLKYIHTIKDWLVKEYSKYYELRNNRISTLRISKWSQEVNYHTVTGYKVFVYGDTIPKQKKDYIRSLSPGYSYFVKKDRPFKLGDLKNASSRSYDSYITILRLYNHPKSQWREMIKEFQYIQSLIEKDFVNIDSMVVPQQWIDDRKKKKVATGSTGTSSTVRRKKLVGEVTGKLARRPDRYVSGKNCVFDTTVINLKDANKLPLFTIYGDQSITEKVDAWFSVLRQNKVRFIVFSDREMKTLKDLDLHNWMTMEEFEKGEHKIFKRAATAYVINQLINENKSTFNRKDELMDVSTDLSEKLDKLMKYRYEYFLNGNDELYKAILQVAQDKNLFDPEMYSLYKEVKTKLEKLPFLNPLLGTLGTYSNSVTKGPIIDAIKDLFKYYGVKIDWKNYKLHVNQEPVEELTEEIVEELEQEA